MARDSNIPPSFLSPLTWTELPEVSTGALGNARWGRCAVDHSPLNTETRSVYCGDTIQWCIAKMTHESAFPEPLHFLQTVVKCRWRKDCDSGASFAVEWGDAFELLSSKCLGCDPGRSHRKIRLSWVRRRTGCEWREGFPRRTGVWHSGSPSELPKRPLNCAKILFWPHLADVQLPFPCGENTP